MFCPITQHKDFLNLFSHQINNLKDYYILMSFNTVLTTNTLKTLILAQANTDKTILLLQTSSQEPQPPIFLNIDQVTLVTKKFSNFPTDHQEQANYQFNLFKAWNQHEKLQKNLPQKSYKKEFLKI
jgi:hypothetical protein